MADTSTQREVVVECFAPYDDHRWVNIGNVGGGGVERHIIIPVVCRRGMEWPLTLYSMPGHSGHHTICCHF